MVHRLLVNRLGSYSDREEFQVEQVIVWVMLPHDGDRGKWLQRAEQLFGDIWQATRAVVSAAEKKSRNLIPQFWKVHDEAATSDLQLAVWGIWIYPKSESADYEVGCNPQFNGPSSLPELPDGHTIMVSRDRDGRVACRE
jgi:hypothetical protein